MAGSRAKVGKKDLDNAMLERVKRTWSAKAYKRTLFILSVSLLLLTWYSMTILNSRTYPMHAVVQLGSQTHLARSEQNFSNSFPPPSMTSSHFVSGSVTLATDLQSFQATLPASLPTEVECSTVHVAMVATGDRSGRELYSTVKSVFMHRTTSLHFHLITDDRAKNILQAMLNTWLLPGLAHDYYDFHQALETVKTEGSPIQCSQTLSIHLNLHLILPDSVRHVIVIEPSSVVTVDLALLHSVTKSRENHLISACGGVCVTYCPDESETGLSRWGAVGLNLKTSLEKRPLSQSEDCSPSAADNVDKLLTELVGGNPEHLPAEACETVRNYDGELLRYKKMEKCPEGMEPLVVPAPSSKKACELFSWERAIQRREVPFFLGHKYTQRDQYDVTLATHLAHNRLDIFERALSNWDGPASVGIYVTDSAIQEVLDFIHNSKVLRDRVNVTYHLVFKVGPSYAPNHMREIGHRYVTTPYVFFLDVDYVPSPGLYQIQHENLRTGAFGSMNKTAVVIPAFETDDKTFQVPSSKSVMVKFFLNNTVRQFHKGFFDPGHTPTNYNRWLATTGPYYVKWDNGYEPYYVTKTSVVSFGHQFIARFHNKCSHALELHMAGYRFLVFPNGFVVHFPHERNKQNMDRLRQCDQKWYARWVKEKREQYNYTKNDIIIFS